VCVCVCVCLCVCVCVCVFIPAGPSTKLFAWGGGDIGGHVLREEEKGSARGSVHWISYNATSLGIEVDPQHCRFGSRKSDFALQALVECITLELK